MKQKMSEKQKKTNLKSEKTINNEQNNDTNMKE